MSFKTFNGNVFVNFSFLLLKRRNNNTAIIIIPIKIYTKIIIDEYDIYYNSGVTSKYLNINRLYTL